MPRDLAKAPEASVSSTILEAAAGTPDVVVVGGGIMGLAIAALASQRNYRVTLFRRGDGGKPRADTLRNQGWLQSGLMYIKRFADPQRGLEVAKEMSSAGKSMLMELGISAAGLSKEAVLRVRTPEEAILLEEQVRALRLPPVRRLDHGEVEALLGPVCEDGTYCTIPDRPFPETEVLMRLRGIAREQGVVFVETDDPVRLSRDPLSPSGISVRTPTKSLRPPVVVAAAGVGNYALLGQLGIPPRMTLHQTPLLVLQNSPMIEAGLFADRERGFSFVQHEVATGMRAIVVGTGFNEETEYVLPEERRVSDEAVAEFEKYLPSCFKQLVARGRFTAGFEAHPVCTPPKHHVEPWIEWISEVPALLLVMPGRATTGMHAADLALAEIEQRHSVPRWDGRALQVCPEWTDDIHMHYDVTYTFDDHVANVEV